MPTVSPAMNPKRKDSLAVISKAPPPAISPSPREKARPRARTSLSRSSVHASKWKDSEWPHRCPERNRQWGATPKAACMAAFRYDSSALPASPLSLEGITPAPSRLRVLPWLSRERVEHPVSNESSVRSGRPALMDIPLWPACAKEDEIGGAPAILDAAHREAGLRCKADAPKMKGPRVLAASMRGV